MTAFDAVAAHAQIDRLSVHDAWESATWDNHQYAPLLGISWEEAQSEAKAEKARLNAAGGDLAAAEQAREDEEEQDGWIPDPYDFLDLGVTGLVIALSAAGCCPITSCSGLAGHLESQPLVAFIADLPRLELIAALTRQVPGCELWAADGRVMVSAETHEPLIELAQVLIAAQTQFTALPAPRRPRSPDEDGEPYDNERGNAPLYPSWDL